MMINKRFKAFVLWLMILSLPAMAACARADADQPIAYRLKWLRNMSTVGDLYALEQGFFRAAGLAVDIKPGGPERDAIRELEMGDAQFGVASADQVIRALAKGSPVVVVAQLFQVNPLQWIYRPDRVTIRRVEDLKGKTIGVTFGKNDEMILRAMLSRARLEASQVQLYGVRLDYTPFYKGQVDLWPIYINTQGVEIGGRLEAANETVAFFNPAEHGVRFVANSVVTSHDLLQNDPQTVRRFVAALLKGWRESIDPRNGPKAIEVVKAYDRDATAGVLQAQLDLTRGLIQPPSGAGAVGAIDQQGWRQTEQIMLEHGQISKPVDVVRHLRFMGP